MTCPPLPTRGQDAASVGEGINIGRAESLPSLDKLKALARSSSRAPRWPERGAAHEGATARLGNWFEGVARVVDFAPCAVVDVHRQVLHEEADRSTRRFDVLTADAARGPARSFSRAHASWSVSARSCAYLASVTLSADFIRSSFCSVRWSSDWSHATLAFSAASSSMRRSQSDRARLRASLTTLTSIA